jgi:hypothetical protein
MSIHKIIIKKLIQELKKSIIVVKYGLIKSYKLPDHPLNAVLGSFWASSSFLANPSPIDQPNMLKNAGALVVVVIFLF